MRSVLLLIALIASCASIAQAQSTTTSGTITDANGQVFAVGSYRIEFNPNGQTAPYYWNKNPFTPQVYSGLLDSSGSFSGLSIPSSNFISPAGTNWKFTVCPASSSPCYTTSITLQGATQNVGSQITPPAITVSASDYNQPTAYSDTEIAGPKVGFLYFNLTDQTIHECTVSLPCTWVSLVSGGGGGGNPAGNIGDLQEKATSTTFGASHINDTGASLNASENVTFVGPNPEIDVTSPTFGGRLLSTVPSTTGTIAIGSHTVTVASTAGFQVGDGVFFIGPGATNPLSTPSAPTVTPVQAAGAIGPGGPTVSSGTGSTAFAYSESWIDATYGLGITAASPTTAISNGLAIGRQSVSITSATRSGNSITYTTSTQTIAAGAAVDIEGMSDTTFDGWIIADSVTGTTITTTTGLNTVVPGTTTSTTGGTAYWLQGNQVCSTAPSSPPYASKILYFGRTGGSQNFVGESPSTNLQSDCLVDYGFAAPYTPAWYPTTAPSQATNDALSTTITAIGSGQFTLAAAAQNVATSSTFVFDNVPALRAAAVVATSSATGGVLVIPSSTAGTNNPFFVTSGPVDLTEFSGLHIIFRGSVQASDTWEFANASIVMQGSGGGNGIIGTGQFGWRPAVIFGCYTAFPCIHGVSSANQSITDIAFQNFDNGLGIQEDGNAGNFTMSWSQFNTVSGSGADYSGVQLLMAGVLVTALDHDTFSGDTSGTYTSNGGLISLIPWTSNGAGNLTCSVCYFVNRGIALSSGSAAGAPYIRIADSYMQGAEGPLFSSSGGNVNTNIELDSVTDDTGNAPMAVNWGGIDRALILTQTLSGIGSRNAISGHAFDYVQLNGLNSFTLALGQNTNVTGPMKTFLDSTGGNGFTNNPLYGFMVNAHFPAQNIIYWDQTVFPAVTSATPGTGGSVPVGAHTYAVAANFPGNSATQSTQTLTGASQTCTTTAGNQTCVVVFTGIAGAINYTGFRDGCKVDGAENLTVLTFTDTHSFCDGPVAGGNGTGPLQLGYQDASIPGFPNPTPAIVSPEVCLLSALNGNAISYTACLTGGTLSANIQGPPAIITGTPATGEPAVFPSTAPQISPSAVYLDASQFAGADAAAKAAACQTAAIAIGQGNVCDLRGLGGNLTFGPPGIILGDSSGDKITFIFPSGGSWNGTGFSGGTQCEMTQHAGSSYVSYGAPNAFIISNSMEGSNAVLHVYCSAGEVGYYYGRGVEFYNGSVTTAGHSAFYFSGAEDNSVYDMTTVFDESASSGETPVGHGGLNCCSLTFYNLTTYTNNTGGPALLLSPSNTNVVSQINFIGGSFGHPGASSPAFECNSTQTSYAQILLVGIYNETNNAASDSTTINQVIGTCAVTVVSDTIHNESSGSTAAAWSVASGGALNMSGLLMTNYTFPATALIDSATSETLTTDSNGWFPGWNSGTRYASNFQAGVQITTPLIQAASGSLNLNSSNASVDKSGNLTVTACSGCGATPTSSLYYNSDWSSNSAAGMAASANTITGVAFTPRISVTFSNIYMSSHTADGTNLYSAAIANSSTGALLCHPTSGSHMPTALALVTYPCSEGSVTLSAGTTYILLTTGNATSGATNGVPGAAVVGPYYNTGVTGCTSSSGVISGTCSFTLAIAVYTTVTPGFTLH